MRKNEPINLLGETIGQAFDRACKERDELLAAAKHAEPILSYFADGATGFSGEGTPKTARDKLRAAIAKTEGRPSW